MCWAAAIVVALSFAFAMLAAAPAHAGRSPWGTTRAAQLNDTGVVVWEGGSIIRGVGAGRARPFPRLTLRLVRRDLHNEFDSYVLWRHRVGIARILATAPMAVDPRYRPSAVVNLCVVLAGGGDFCRGVDPATVLTGLKSYCAGRRAAGFRVLVMTVLPRSRPAGFEARRTVYNQLLRTRWREFADGLVDVAADRRIGDAGDNRDRRYYGPDAVHPNVAGNAVMARRAARVIDRVLRRPGVRPSAAGATEPGAHAIPGLPASPAPGASAAPSARPAVKPAKWTLMARIVTIVARAFGGAAL